MSGASRSGTPHRRTTATTNGTSVSRARTAASGAARERGTGGGTAGAAEIAANALFDLKRAEVVGERTYGDAAIRKPVVMDDGAAVILSVAKFHNSNGKALQDVGVMPSVPVADLEPQELNEEDAPVPPVKKEEKPKSTEDLILKKAIEISMKGLSPEEVKAAQAMRDAAKKAAETSKDPSMGPLNIPKP